MEWLENFDDLEHPLYYRQTPTDGNKGKVTIYKYTSDAYAPHGNPIVGLSNKNAFKDFDLHGKLLQLRQLQ